jgi:protein-tyrosine phosphatase
MANVIQIGRKAHIVKALLLKRVKRIARFFLSESSLRLIRICLEVTKPYGQLYVKLRVLKALGLNHDRADNIPVVVRSVLFVCHGNIIRSPFAAESLKALFKSSGQKNVAVISAGLSARSGRRADSRALAVSREFGISLDEHVAHPLTEQLVADSDVIFVMDYFNKARLLTRYPNACHKAFLLGTYLPRHAEIEDPYHGHVSDVRKCYQVVNVCLQSFLDSLEQSRARIESNADINLPSAMLQEKV